MQGWLRDTVMKSIDLRIPLFAGVAAVLLAVSPAHAQTTAQEIMFVPGTGDSVAVEQTEAAPSPMAFADERAEQSDSQAELMAMADKLSDPRMQDGVANMVGQLTERMMDLPVGKFAAAIERARPGTVKRGIRENTTVADLAGRDAERLPDDLAKGTRQAIGMMSGFAAAFASMLPEFEKLGREMEKSFEDIRDASRDRK
jgi:hypothetical protein